MKLKNLLMMSLVLLFTIAATLFGVPDENVVSTKSSIQLATSPELSDMVTDWVSEYKSIQPGSDFTLESVPEQGLNDFLQKEGTIALVTKESLTKIEGEPLWTLVIGRDVLVPVMNAKNPFREEILQKGISPEAFSKVYTSSGVQTWGSVLNNSSNAPVAPYVISGSSNAYLADFINTDAQKIRSRSIAGTEKMVEAIQKDPYAIGFLKLAEIMAISDGEINAGLSLIPVDMNGNAAIDKMEGNYQSVADLNHGIWIGKYPGALYSRLYAVANSRPSGDDELAFLEWIISDGQQLLATSGYVALNRSEKYIKGEQLAEHGRVALEIPATNLNAKVLFVVIGGIVILMLLVYLVARIFGSTVSDTGEAAIQALSQSGEKTATFPGGLFFDKSHTWAFMEKDGKVRVGIDEFLQHVTGPITRVRMKNPGERIKKGESFLSLVQQGKKLEIKSPVSGIIAEQNGGLLDDSSMINTEPYSGGWVYVVEPQNWISELKNYFMGQPYTDWLKTEAVRFKEFCVSALKTDGTKEPALVMQDGGEIRGAVLESFGPEVWEEFQNSFINKAK